MLSKKRYTVAHLGVLFLADTDSPAMIVLSKKRYIATLLGVLFLAAYSVLLLSGSRGIRSSLATLSPAEGSALSTLARWDTLLQSRKDQGLDAASQSALARMQRSLAAYTGSASGSAPQGEGEGEGDEAAASGQQLPAAGQPVNVVLLGGPTLGDEELWTTLSSISASAPEAVVLLLATPSQLSALAPSVTAPGAQRAAAPVDSSQQTSWRAARTRPLPLWLRAYSWPALEASLPPAVLALPHSLRRYALYLEALEELASASASASTSDLVLFSNLDAPRRTAPAGVLLCTSPDLVFQSNPFPGLWQLLQPPPAAPAAAPVTVVVSGEANVLQLRQDDASRARVSFCYYDLGEAMAGEQQIYSSGATFSTLQGIRHYIKEGMLPAMAHCATPNFDQVRERERGGGGETDTLPCAGPPHPPPPPPPPNSPHLTEHGPGRAQHHHAQLQQRAAGGVAGGCCSWGPLPPGRRQAAHHCTASCAAAGCGALPGQAARGGGQRRGGPGVHYAPAGQQWRQQGGQWGCAARGGQGPVRHCAADGPQPG